MRARLLPFFPMAALLLLLGVLLVPAPIAGRASHFFLIERGSDDAEYRANQKRLKDLVRTYDCRPVYPL